MPPQNFLIVRLGAMGDVLHAMPAIAALRQAVPDATISWVVDPRWSPLLCSGPGPYVAGSEAMPLIDTIYFADTRAWSRRPFSIATIQSILTLRRQLRATAFDAVIDLQGSIRSAVISRFARSKVVIGSASPREVPASWFYSTRVSTHSEHVIEQAAEITSVACRQTLLPQPAPLPRDTAAEKWCDDFLALIQKNSSQRIAVITPGAGWGAKRWPAELYGEVAAGLAILGITTLVNCGPGEASLAATVVESSNGHARPVDCTLPQLIALLRRTALFIGGDTGPLHLAAALGVPAIGIYGPTDPHRNGPYGTCAIVLRHPTSRRNHTRLAATEAGLLAIPAAAVLDAAHTLLQQSSGGPSMSILQNFGPGK